MPADDRAKRMERLQQIIAARSPTDWLDEQLADIESKRSLDRSARVT
jgi:hypothetical protein